MNDIEEGEEERKKGEEKRGDYRGVNNREFEGKKKRGRKGGKKKGKRGKKRGRNHKTPKNG